MNLFKKTLSTCLLCLAIGSASAETLDINSADADSLAATITGIGPARAQAIVAFRKANGPFSSVDDLVLVKGIGSATVDKNRDKLKAAKH
jgi:competence protein ComEA